MTISKSEKYKKIYRDKRTIMVNNLLGGIAWGVGSVIGATLIVGSIGFILVKAEKIPLVGDFVEVVLEQVRNGREISQNIGQ